MARSRTISPKFFQNEDLAELPYEARLLFIGLWTIADRSGRLEDRPKRIQIQLFPYGLQGDVDALLELLDQHEFIFRYQAENEQYIQIPKWFSYQHPHPHEVESVIPQIQCNLTDFKGCRDMARSSRDKSLHVMTCQAGSSVPSVSSVPSYLPPAPPLGFTVLPSEEFSSTPKNGTHRVQTETPEFAEFWKMYPWKVGKGAARPKFKLALAKSTWEKIKAGLVQDLPRLLEQGQKGFRLHPATWLNAEGWENETAPVEEPQLDWMQERIRQAEIEDSQGAAK